MKVIWHKDTFDILDILLIFFLPLILCRKIPSNAARQVGYFRYNQNACFPAEGLDWTFDK